MNGAFFRASSPGGVGSLSNQPIGVFKNDNLGSASLTNPRPELGSAVYESVTVKPMWDWNTARARRALPVCEECRIDVWTMQNFLWPTLRPKKKHIFYDSFFI